MELTFRQRVELHSLIKARIEDILKDHMIRQGETVIRETDALPVSHLETDYLAEIVLMMHGLSEIDTQPAQAVKEWRSLLNLFESSSRISPAEHKQLWKLYTQGIGDMMGEVKET